MLSTMPLSKIITILEIGGGTNLAKRFKRKPARLYRFGI
jgi:hypothetical protein